MREVADAFSTNLIRERKLAGLTQEELSYRASLHRTEISQLERGIRIARLDTVIKLAGALGVDACVLLGGIKWISGTYEPGAFSTEKESR